MTNTTVAPLRPRARRRPPTGRLAVFDLDRTLLPGSSLFELGRVLADRGVIDRTVVARHALVAAVFARRGLPDSRIERVRDRVLAASADRDGDQLASVAREVGVRLASGAHPAARWLIDRHHAAGDVCVVLSASPQELVEAVGAGLGADRSIGTRVEVVGGRLTGRLDGAFCHGSGKLERLRDELGEVDLDRAVAYADSGSDLPLLAACGHPVAVNPDRRLRDAAAAGGWPVLRLG
ncbi:MAG TPA: HAD family hydrolase [Acidimicrobiales bacterium]|jgi:HAD superfamily hydrolase (TIGR01490 family)|nr:HAD family hydrolase [Acidimicrobiales bacterium]